MVSNIIAIYDIIWTYGNEKHKPQGTITITTQTQKSISTSPTPPSQYLQLLDEEIIKKNSEIQDIDYRTYCLIREFQKSIEQAEMKFKEVQEALEGTGTKFPVAAEIMAKMRSFASELLSPSRRDLDEDEDGNDSEEGNIVDEIDFIEDDGNNAKEDVDNEEIIYQAVLKYSNISAKFACEPTDSSNHTFKNFNKINEFTILKDTTIIPKSSFLTQITSMNIAKDTNDFLFLKFIIFKKNNTGMGSDDSPIIGFAKRRPILNIPSVTDAEIDGILEEEEEYSGMLQEDVDKQVGDDTFELSSEDLLENVDGDLFRDGGKEEGKEDQGKEILVPLVHRTKDRFLLDEDDLIEDEFSDFGIEDGEEIRGDEEVQNETSKEEEKEEENDRK